MFSGVRNVFGLIKVSTKNGIITIDGIPADVLVKLINTIAQTRKITNNMFTLIQKNKLQFHEFFAVEVVFVLETLKLQLKSYRYMRIVSKIIEHLQEETWLKTVYAKDYTPCIDMSYLKNIKWTLLPHQAEFLQLFSEMVPRYQLHGYLLASPPGTGKTLSDLALAGCIVPRELAEVKIIISPKNAVGLVWADTVKKIFRKIPTYWTSEEKGSPPLGKEYYIFHYESMDRALALAKALAQYNIKYFVIVDECHNFNNPASQRTKNLISLCTLAPDTYSVWASGTPVKALGTEMIPLLTSIDDKFTPEVSKIFKKIFGGDMKYANEILADRLGKITFKVPKSAVVSNKPTTIKRMVTLKNSDRYLTSTVKGEMRDFIVERVKFYQADMQKYRDIFDTCLDEYYATLKTRQEKKDYNQYRDIVKQLRKASASGGRPDMQTLAWCKTFEETKILPNLSADSKKKFKQTRSIVKALVLKVQGEALGRVLDKRRTECITDLALNCDLPSIINDAIAKTIVFATRVGPIETTAKMLEEQGYQPQRVYADTNKDLTKLINDFTNIPEINPICATFQSLSTAVPVIAANTIVMLDLPPRDYMYSQAVARANRLGQKNPVFVIEVLLDTKGEPNISTRMDEIVSWSREQVAALLGDDFAEDPNASTENVEGLDMEDND